MIHVLGISVWIHFIWIFVLGVLLFFHLVHGTVFEGYQVGGGSSTGGGSGLVINPVIGLSSTSTAPVWVQRYQSGSWTPIGASTDRLLYQDKLPKGGKLVSSKALFTLLFNTDGRLILYNSSVGVSSNSLPTSSGCSGSSAGSSACINGYPILWSFSTGSAASYLQHQGSNKIRVINADGSASSNQPFSSPAATTTSLNKSYLQILDTGDLVWFASDGMKLYSTGTAVTNVMTGCGEVDFTSPLDQSDCFTLSNFLQAKLSDISTFSSNGSTTQLDAAQKSLCAIQAYYSALSCDAYRATVPVVRSLPTFDVLAPSASIKGSISMGSDTITTTGSMTSLVSFADIVYLGYGTNVQGPFVVKSVTSTAIMITKRYIGAPVTNAIISVTRVDPYLDANSDPEIMKISGLEIVAAVHPGDKHIAIGSSVNSPLRGSTGTPTICGSAADGGTITLLSPSGPFTGIQSIYYGTPVGNCTNGFQAGTCNALEADLASFRETIKSNCIGKTTCSITVNSKTIGGCSGGTKTLAVILSTAATGDNLPKNIEIGDILYIRKSECNPYDTDNGDGTCTARLCRIGEIDDQKGNCIPFSCKTEPRFVGGPTDTDNGDGTCTSPTVYNNNTSTITPTQLVTNSETRTLTIGLTVNSTYFVDTDITYTTPAMALGFVYDKTRRGIRGTPYSKLTANPALTTYTYSKRLGPFVVASRPTTNKIGIKLLDSPSLTTGRLDSNGRFILHPLAKNRKDIIEAARANDGKPVNMYTRDLTQQWQENGTWVRLGVEGENLTVVSGTRVRYIARNNPIEKVITGPPNSLVTFPATTAYFGSDPAQYFQKVVEYYSVTNVLSYSGAEDMNALPETGLVDTKLYKIKYNDGVFRGSFTSIIAGTNAINERTTLSITTGTSGSEGISQTGVNGKQIDLTGNGQQWDGTFNISNFLPYDGLQYTVTISVSSSVNTYIALEDSFGDEYAPNNAEGSSITQGSNPSLSSASALNNKVLVTPTRKTFVWTFICRNGLFNIHAYKTVDTAAVTFTFSYLEIKGGVTGPVQQLACSNGTTTTNGITQCKPSAADVAAGSALSGSRGAAANAAASRAATAALACANGTAAPGMCGGGSSGSGSSKSGSRGSNSGSSPLSISKIQWAADAAAAAATNAGGRPEQVLAAATAAAIQAGAGSGSASSTAAEIAQKNVDKQIMNQ
jgi:hypothetical protein